LIKSTGSHHSDDWRYGLRGLNGVYGDFGHKDNTLTMAALANEDWKKFSRRLVERLYDRSLTQNDRFDYKAEFKGKKDLEWMYEQAVKNTAYVIITLWASMIVKDYRNLLKEIDRPALITYGEGSNYYPKENSEYMKSNLKNAVVVSFPGCGHALHIQDYLKFNTTLTNFLNSHTFSAGT